MNNADFSWFADGSHLKGDNGTYCIGYVISLPCDVIEVEPLPLAAMAQQAKLQALQQACSLAKGKTAHIYTDSSYAFLSSAWGSKLTFLPPAKMKFKMASMLRNYQTLDFYLLR